jgi:hypothetical protein
MKDESEWGALPDSSFIPSRSDFILHSSSFILHPSLPMVMRDLIKEAFFLRVPVAGLGALPVNLLALAAFAILGFGFPPLWAFGALLEIGYLFALATSPRFKRLVAARRAAERDLAAEADWRAAAATLSAEDRTRIGALEAKYRRVLELYRTSSSTSFLVEANQAALEKLLTSYARLLGARHVLVSLEDRRAAEMRLAREAAELERALGDTALASQVRSAKEATLTVVRKRLENLKRRDESLDEIASRLAQIEANVDLALENAAMGNHPDSVSADIDVASFLLDDFGGLPPYTVAEPPPRRERERL